MKKHETIPNEPQENPVPDERPEILRPSDPNGPVIPHEDDERTPEELPQIKSPGEDAPVIPDSF